MYDVWEAFIHTTLESQDIQPFSRHIFNLKDE